MAPSAPNDTTPRRRPELFVVDGSNIATEGRSVPSLEQLNDAVLAFLDVNPDAVVTVVVDATFGHRIDKREVKAFDEAVANNELVTPPAGAVGRGDAFVLAIADRAGAGILSNDSFQEFHGEYEWLFDDGRLIGGKPVPHVGWVFVKRSPVRGPKSRQAVRAANGDVTASKQRANRRVRKKDGDDAPDADIVAPASTGTTDEPVGSADAELIVERATTSAPAKSTVNELMPFLEFVQRHPVGTSCTAVVESYSSHGAYARAGDVLVYVPLRLMDDPPPRSARRTLALGEAITTVIVRYVPDRRSIDAALPHMAELALGTTPAVAATDGSPEAASPSSLAAMTTAVVSDAPSTKRPRRRAAAKVSADDSSPVTVASDEPVVNGSAVKKSAAKKSPARKSAANKAPAAKPSAATKTPTAPAKKTPAKKAAAKPSPAKKTPAKKAAAKPAPAKKMPAKKTAVNKAPAKKTAAKDG